MAAFRLILAAMAALTFVATAEAENSSVYTSVALDQCRELPADMEDDPVAIGNWECEGYQGIRVLIYGGDERFTVSYGSDAENEPAAGQTLPSFNYLGEKLEWRLDEKGRPIATILRFHETPDGAPQRSTLIVTRLGPPGQICWVGKVDAVANPDANEIARAVADNFAENFQCGAEPGNYGVDGEPAERF